MNSESNTVKLSIIIVNWNGYEFLPNCLKSIVENPPGVSYEIVLVDNDSSDKSVEWLKSVEAEEILKNTKFTLIESKENLGFGRANNLAIEKTDSPYVFLLNPDTLVKADAIDNLLEALKSEANIGATAPKIFGPDGNVQPSVWAFPPTAFRFFVEGLKLEKFIPQKIRGNLFLGKHWHYEERKVVPMFSGTAIMAKREMIDQVGGFAPQFYMYGEDAEWCVRITRSGWLLVFTPTAELFHLGGQSAVQRWGESETRLKEEKGFMEFQKDCLTPFQLMKNTAVRTVIFYLYKIKGFFSGEKIKILDELINLQISGFKYGLHRLFLLSDKKRNQSG